jgi:membrane protease YdiL (CAAX protease family)
MARKSDKTEEAKRSKKRTWSAWMLGYADGYEGYFAQSRSLALSFVLIAPLLLIYELALMYYTPAKATGAGGALRNTLSRLFQTRPGMILNIAVVVLLLVAVFVAARKRTLRVNLIVPMVLESAVWSIVLVGIAVLICNQSTVTLDTGGGGARSIVLKVIWSIGAGVYEEIVFRLILASLLCYAGWKLFDEDIGKARTFAVVTSALLFALCHFVVPGARPLGGPGGLALLLFYFTSGLFFSMLYIYRGLGVAVYTHVIYDIVVRIANG